ncbi:MAG TPA: hypothetical protein VMY18_11165 [Acidobacteriota bacterium]|nr:hypothetical protein [Acidobacteriota bacterium]
MKQRIHREIAVSTQILGEILGGQHDVGWFLIEVARFCAGVVRATLHCEIVIDMQHQTTRILKSA